MHALEPGAATGAPATRPCTSRARARPPSCSPGRLALMIDDERHDLAAGDSVTFDADLPHHFSNDGDEPAEFLAVVAAGLRRG